MSSLETMHSLERLRQLTEVIHESRGLEDLLDVLVSRAADLPGVDTVRILLTDPEGNELTAEVGIGFPADADSEDVVPIGLGFAGGIAASRQPLLIPDIKDFPVYGRTLRAAGVRCALGVPLIAGTLLVGVMHIGSRQVGTFGPDAIPLLEDIAERVALTVEAIRAEQAMHASERRFRSLFEDAPVGICLADLRETEPGRILLANQAMCRITGYSEGQLQAMRVSDLLAPDDRVLAVAGMEALAGGDSDGYAVERRGHRADGTDIWIRGSVSAVTEDGLPAYSIAYVEDITARKTAEAELARRALTDPLTGLANRHLVMDHLELALRQHARTGGLVGVLYLDLDRFKEINDLYGHDVGDRVLQEVARRLNMTVRAADTPARLGGDEFVVVCPQLTGAEELTTIAARLLFALSEQVRVLGAPPFEVSASIGAAVGRRDVESDELVRRADVAMYEAKRLGRRRCHSYRPALDAASRRRRTAESLLGSALDNGWFRLHYQPIVDLTTHARIGAEALLRIEHPDRGLLMPDDFIDILEESDLAEPVEQWVLDEACRRLKSWSGRGLPTLSVNISGRVAATGQLTAMVLSAARAADVEASTLCVEMTERVLVQAGEAILDDLGDLAEHGVSIAIDDFGTGYASLAYLQRFPIDAVKIDRSFVAGLGHGTRDDAIVTAISALGAALGLRVVAEAVEHAEQVDRLCQMGCLLGQGFHFGRPCPPEAFAGVLSGPGAR